MNVRLLRPVGCPLGIDPSTWRKALVERIERQANILSNLVDALDRIDGDCELETNGDAEPWLGWCAGGAIGNRYDIEVGDEDSRDKGFN